MDRTELHLRMMIPMVEMDWMVEVMKVECGSSIKKKLAHMINYKGLKS